MHASSHPEVGRAHEIAGAQLGAAAFQHNEELRAPPPGRPGPLRALAEHDEAPIAHLRLGLGALDQLGNDAPRLTLLSTRA